MDGGVSRGKRREGKTFTGTLFLRKTKREPGGSDIVDRNGLVHD